MPYLWLRDGDMGFNSARTRRPAAAGRDTSDNPPPERSPGYCIPREVTLAGAQAFKEEVQQFAAQLMQEMELDAHRAHRTDPHYTADDVREAIQAHHRRISRRTRGDDSARHVLAAILLTLSTVGVSTMANFLHSPWQIVAFALLVVAGLIGLVLTWVIVRQRPVPSGGGGAPTSQPWRSSASSAHDV